MSACSMGSTAPSTSTPTATTTAAAMVRGAEGYFTHLPISGIKHLINWRGQPHLSNREYAYSLAFASEGAPLDIFDGHRKSSKPLLTIPPGGTALLSSFPSADGSSGILTCWPYMPKSCVGDFDTLGVTGSYAGAIEEGRQGATRKVKVEFAFDKPMVDETQGATLKATLHDAVQGTFATSDWPASSVDLAQVIANSLTSASSVAKTSSSVDWRREGLDEVALIRDGVKNTELKIKIKGQRPMPRSRVFSVLEGLVDPAASASAIESDSEDENKDERA